MWLGLIAMKPEDARDGEIQIHLILIGHTGVGKTSLRKHLKNELIDMKESPTIVMEPEFLYRESVVSDSAFKHIKDMSTTEKEKVFLTMWDTGGQPVFQDLLPCFARLNCMYGVVFRLTDIEDFETVKPTIRPCDHHHQMAMSPFTKKDIFYRNLAFVQAFSCSTQEKLKELPILSNMSDSTSNHCSPASVIVGTCKDELKHTSKQLEEKKKKTYEEMKKFIKDNNISNIQDDNILEIDNTVSGKKVDPGIERLRKTIHQCAEDSKLKIKPSWHRFKLCLQRACYQQDQYLNQGIMPLNEVIAIGTDPKLCGLQKSEVKSVLTLFHEIGIVMWYHMSSRPSMNNFVVIDHKTLLDVLSKIFCFNPKSITESEQQVNKGVISLTFFQQLLKSKASRISDEWLVAFLEEHNLCAKITLPDGEAGYFLPSILCTETCYESNIPEVPSISPVCIVPQSKKGANSSSPNYIPTGVFTRLLTALAGVTFGSTVWKIPLESSKISSVCRNQYEFVVSDFFHVILSEFSQYIRMDAIPCDDKKPISSDVLMHIITTLDVQLQRVVPRWMEERQFRLTFACDNPTCAAQPPHYFTNIDIPVKFSSEGKCSNYKTIALEPSQEVWHGSSKTKGKFFPHNYSVASSVFMSFISN